MSETLTMDRNLALEAVRVTEVAALAASRLMGRGDEKAADQAAVDAMRGALNVLSIDGTVVIGGGEREEAPRRYIGEKVGRGGPRIALALDPLEGTTITAKGGANALAVMAMANEGGFLNAPDVYMDKIAVGGGLPADVVDIDKDPEANLRSLAAAKNCEVADLVACILDRPRHADLIAAVPDAGGLMLVPAFTGWGTPHWDPQARGLLVGLTRDSHRGHIARAALEGIALSVATLVELAETALGHDLGELAVDGGAAASDPLLQAQANTTGLTVRRPVNLESTARGVALMAGVQAGLIADLAELVPQRHEGAQLFHPQIDHRQRQRLKERWAEAVNRSLRWHD